MREADKQLETLSTRISLSKMDGRAPRNEKKMRRHVVLHWEFSHGEENPGFLC